MKSKELIELESWGRQHWEEFSQDVKIALLATGFSPLADKLEAES